MNNKIAQLGIVLSFFLSMVSCNQNTAVTELDFTSSWDTLRVLENPHKGWYHHLLDNGISTYSITDDSVFFSFPGMDHLYLRLAWSYLEPVEGEFDWSYIDRVVEKYVPLGYKISFRITCSETGSYPDRVGEQVGNVQYATPSWVEKAGASGIIDHRGNARNWVPDWDDPIYLEKLNQFHRAFAARYDGKPWVRYVDIGSIGDWGEGHTYFTTRIPATMAEVKANMDIYLNNYKKTQIAVCYGYLFTGKPKNEEEELFQYAISKGITLRCDSPLVDSYFQDHLETWTHSHPHYYDPLYLQKPIVFELEHYGTVKDKGNWLGKNGSEKISKYGYSGAEIMRNAIKVMHATYIGYHGYVEEWLEDNPELTKELANLCGYWYFPLRTEFNPELSEGENTLSIQWLNKGIAPAYNTYGLLLRLTNMGNDQHTDVLIEDSGNENWLPDSPTVAEYTFQLPENMKAGNYFLKFKLIESSGEKYLPIDLGLRKESFDPQGFVTLGSVSVK